MRASPSQRVVERRRAVLLTQHYRHQEGLTVPQIAALMGLSEGSIRAYLHDPDGSKAQAIKESYRGVCEVCGAATSGEGPGRARPVCTRCANQDNGTWSPRRIHAALRAQTCLQRTHTATAASAYDGYVKDGKKDPGQQPASSNTTAAASRKPTAKRSQAHEAACPRRWLHSLVLGFMLGVRVLRGETCAAVRPR